MKLKELRKYEGFSLIEMLLTISIIGIVMLISSVTLTALIKVSTVASNKIRARSESEFVLELVRRTVRNSDPTDVLIFDTLDYREYDYEGNTVVDSGIDDISILYTNTLGENEDGNEIHLRPYGHEDWICIGYFQSPTEEGTGYILRTTASDLSGNHESCFNPASASSLAYLITLNSDYVNVLDFKINYTISSDTNYVIRFDIQSEPVDWYLGQGAPISRTVFRQGVVSTEGLIW